MKRFGITDSSTALPFASAVQADGWLYVSGQMPVENGDVIAGAIAEQTHTVLRKLFAILKDAGYGAEHIVRCGVWLDDPRDFASFNKVYREYFGEHLPARACVRSGMVLDCKVEVDCIAFDASRRHA